MTNGLIRLLVLFALFPGACSKAPEALLQLEQSGSTMGTTFSVSVVIPSDEAASFGLEDEIIQALSRIENSMSTYIPGSELSLFNASVSDDWQTVSVELCVAIEQSLQLAELTNGAFDITIGPLVNLWGFGPDGVIQEPPAESDLQDALKRTGYGKLDSDCVNSLLRKSDANLYVDLSAYAKGFAVDRLAELLEQNKFDNYLVEIGGEVRAQGHNSSGDSWRIAIEEPADNNRSVQTIINITDMAIATSGDYRNFFDFGNDRYSHTIDPRTGRPVRHQLASVSVVAGQAARADALATAMLVMGPVDGPRFAERNAISALFLVHEGSGIDEIMSGDFANLISH
ncbi:MAG: thiamine biosynthesis lipoprotein [Woeseiaceae bacterium]|jgi:thiamine biosynthesis lipoprotein